MMLDNEGNVRSRQINNLRIRELLGMLIIEHDLPYSFVEFPLFRQVLKECNPDVKIISRKTAVSDIRRFYELQKDKLKVILSKSPSRICLTSDCWTAVTSEGYICLTAHFVDENWKLNSKILSFCKMEPPHSGHELASKVFESLCDWEIEKKIFTVTLDNASANDCMAEILKERLILQNNLICDGEFFYVRCCAHILNLIVQEGLKVTNVAINKIRDSIKYVKVSESRMKIFGQCVEQVGSIDTSIGLRLDVPTRWNSTYDMLESGIRYKRAFVCLSCRDTSFKHSLSNEEWRRAEEMCSFLQPCAMITTLISGTSYPTSNMYFGQIAKIEILLNDAISNRDPVISNMATKMKEKFDKYWSDYSVILSIGSVFDPRAKLEAIKFSYSLIDPVNYYMKVDHIKQKLYYIFDQYKDMGGSSNNRTSSSTPTPSQPSSSTSGRMVEKKKESAMSWTQLYGDFLNFKSRDVSSVGKSELDYYLEEASLDGHQFPELDVLQWWKTNQQ
ncbi:zinc finger BED domain-containing protein RICESLEEPER 2-like [Prosopis cineraria]|uniref:zinc finger BED domain-containing protein RICESLEEPER 2-like n=1 Tax=Prosopis cineraria TaxID=364024 RepID=UPI00240F6938|nr:zinc finger BED domain-containing protein RICESLEEPER 2-like [Prosopis cineraria]